MFVAIMKILAVTAAMAGPFIVGAMMPFARDPEVYAFFVVAGISLGIAGLFGFAALDRGELHRHVRNLYGSEG
jgi:uncharacterized membrane protein